MYEQTQRERRLRQENFDYGYRLEMAGQDIERCTNNDQRDGWKAAHKGHMAAEMAAADVETTMYLRGAR